MVIDLLRKYAKMAFFKMLYSSTGFVSNPRDKRRSPKLWLRGTALGAEFAGVALVAVYAGPGAVVLRLLLLLLLLLSQAQGFGGERNIEVPEGIRAAPAAVAKDDSSVFGDGEVAVIVGKGDEQVAVFLYY